MRTTTRHQEFTMVRSLALTGLLAVATAAPAADAPDYAALRKKMELAMGPVPGADRKVPLDVKVVSEEKLDGYVRKKVTFSAEKGDRVPAWLLIPTGREGKRPAMLCLHQTINIGKDEPVGLGKQDSKAQALHLVKRGYVCLALDYPSFGEYQYDFKAAFKAGLYQSGTMKAIWNNMRAIDLLQSLPEVDPDRIGAIGHSLGGHNTLYTAAFDDRIKVAVSSCGFNSFHKYYGGNLKGWTSDRYMPRIASEYGNDPKRVPFDFDDVLLAICPRAVFAMSPLKDSNFEVSGVKDVIAKVEPAYKKLGAEAKLKAIYPDAGHEWPEEARKEAYEFVDKILKP
jgi:dienelactone hydrolase